MFDCLLVALVSWRQMMSASKSSRNDLSGFPLFFRTALSPFTFQDTILMSPTPIENLRNLRVYGNREKSGNYFVSNFCVQLQTT